MLSLAASGATQLSIVQPILRSATRFRCAQSAYEGRECFVGELPAESDHAYRQVLSRDAPWAKLLREACSLRPGDNRIRTATEIPGAFEHQACD